MRAILPIALALVLSTRSASAEPEAAVVVLLPDGGADVARGDVELAGESIRTAVADFPDARVATQTAGELSAGHGLGCAADPQCVAEVGRKLGARRVIAGVLLSSGSGFSLTLQAVDTDSGVVVEKSATSFARSEVGTVPGQAVQTLIGLAPPLELLPPAPDPAVEAPESSDAETEVNKVGVTSENPTRDVAWHLGIRAGALAPRGDLDLGPTLGVALSHAPRSGRLRLFAVLDWVLLTRQDSTLVGPPAFPRARADLIQSSSELAIYAGGSYDLFETGSVDIYAGAGVGAAVSSSRFEAFSASVEERDTSLLLAIVAGARGPLSRVYWNIEGAWRESSHDLGDSGDYGETLMGGWGLSVGLGYSF